MQDGPLEEGCEESTTNLHTKVDSGIESCDFVPSAQPYSKGNGRVIMGSRNVTSSVDGGHQCPTNTKGCLHRKKVLPRSVDQVGANRHRQEEGTNEFDHEGTKNSAYLLKDLGLLCVQEMKFQTHFCFVCLPLFQNLFSLVPLFRASIKVFFSFSFPSFLKKKPFPPPRQLQQL